MNEAEWLACADPTPMLEYLWGKASERKLRLFACACCRRIWHLLTQECSRRAVEAAELCSDGVIGKDAMGEARAEALAAFVRLPGGEDLAPAAAISAAGIPSPRKSYLDQLLDAFDDPWWEDEFDKGDPHAAAVVTARNAVRAAAYEKGVVFPIADDPAQIAEELEQARVVRDIFGNPFRPKTIDPGWLAWNNGTVPKIAQAVYDDRSFDRLPILADALTEAGCTNEDILAHCRSGGEHVRGCCVVDLVLGKG